MSPTPEGRSVTTGPPGKSFCEELWNKSLVHETLNHGLLLGRLTYDSSLIRQFLDTRTDIGSPHKCSYGILKLSLTYGFFLLEFLKPTLDHSFQRGRALTWLSYKSTWVGLVSIHQTLIVKAKLTRRFVNRLWVLGYRLNCCNQSLNNIAFNRIHFHFSFMQ